MQYIKSMNGALRWAIDIFIFCVQRYNRVYVYSYNVKRYYKVLYTCCNVPNIIQSGTTMKHVELLRLIKQNRIHKQLAQTVLVIIGSV